MDVRRQIPRPISWWLSVALSVLLHAGVAALLSIDWIVPERSHADKPATATSDPMIEPRRDDLFGIEASDRVTLTWLGFADPTPHSARLLSTVEQAELARAAGMPGEPVPAAELRPDPEPIPEPVAASPPAPEADTSALSDATEPLPPADPVEPVPAPPPADTLLAEAPDWTLEASPRDPVSLPEVPLPSVDPRVTPAPSVDPASAEAAADAAETLDVPAAEPVPAEANRPATQAEARPQPPTPPVESGAPEAEPGEPSDRSADAVAAERIPDVLPGRPAATEGLEVLTVRPQLSTTTLVMARPRNPTVVIEFDAKGRVKRADFLVENGRTRNSGHRAVDDALLAAVYRWSARGPKIEALGEDETLTRTLDISWR